MAGLGAEHAARSMIRDKPRHSLQRLVRLGGFYSGSDDFHAKKQTIKFSTPSDQQVDRFFSSSYQLDKARSRLNLNV